MGVSVNSSTINTSQLFTSRFRIPEYQRPYSWQTEKDGSGQVIDFWNDLSGALKDQPYFLGSMIFTVENGSDRPRDVVDGQQRLVTLSLLANALRWVAKELGEELFVTKIENDLLYSLDLVRRDYVPKIEFLSGIDEATYASLLEDPMSTLLPQVSNRRMVEAQKYFLNQLHSTVEMRKKQDPDDLNLVMYLSDWMKLLASGIELTVYEHPTTEDAFKVFEIINSRGMSLTPAQMIKSYVVGNSSDKNAAVKMWQTLENAFIAIDQEDQLTNFIRHVVTLDIGYVLPRDLFEKIKKHYNTSEDVDQLLLRLAGSLDAYLLLVQPDIDTQREDSEIIAATILNTLKISTARPLLLSVMLYVDKDEREELLRLITQFVVRRIASGSFGTGYVESVIGSTSQAISKNPSMAKKTLKQGLQELQRSKKDFAEALANKRQAKGLLQVLLCSLADESAFPNMKGYTHQIRPVGADTWKGFSEEDYAELRNTLANTALLDMSKRPTYKKDWEDVREVFSSHLIDEKEASVFSQNEWNVAAAKRLRAGRIADLTEIWYE